MSNTLVLGGGFAAVAAVERLRSGIGPNDEITLVSAGRNFLFYPALIPLVFGDLKAADLKFDLKKVMSDNGIRFVEARVSGIGTNSRTVLAAGKGATQSLEYDHLIVALGRRLSADAIPGFSDFAHHLLSVESALRFKSALDSFSAGNIVVGLCPGSTLPVPVCEATIAIARRFRKEIDEGDVSVTAIFPAGIEDAFAGSALFRDISGAMARERVRLVLDFPISKVTETSLLSSDGINLNHDLLLLMPPFTGQGPLLHPAIKTDNDGFISVDDRMRVQDCEGIYAAGDCVALDGPKFGYMAVRQGRVAADNVLAEIRGEEPESQYRHVIEWALGEKYTDPVYFHYGLWDDTLNDADENALFGMSKSLRSMYGGVKPDHVATL